MKKLLLILLLTGGGWAGAQVVNYPGTSTGGDSGGATNGIPKLNGSGTNTTLYNVTVQSATVDWPGNATTADSAYQLIQSLWQTLNYPDGGNGVELALRYISHSMDFVFSTNGNFYAKSYTGNGSGMTNLDAIAKTGGTGTNTTLRYTSGANLLTPSSTTLHSEDQSVEIDFGGGTLDVDSYSSVDWVQGGLFSPTTHAQTVDWLNKLLFNDGGNAVAGWNATGLYGNGSQFTNVNGTNISLGTISTNKMTPEAYVAFMSGGGGVSLPSDVVGSLTNNGSGTLGWWNAALAFNTADNVVSNALVDLIGGGGAPQFYVTNSALNKTFTNLFGGKWDNTGASPIFYVGPLGNTYFTDSAGNNNYVGGILNVANDLNVDGDLNIGGSQNVGTMNVTNFYGIGAAILTNTSSKFAGDFTNTSATASTIAGYDANKKLISLTTGTGIITALGVNTGSAGAPVLFNGLGGTPSQLNGANITNLPTLNQNTTGSAATLTTSRTIGGSSFNGSANVTSFPAAGAIGATTPAIGHFTQTSYTTNSGSTVAPNFLLGAMMLATNNNFAILTPVNLNLNKFETCVFGVTNSTAAAKTIAAPANCHTQGTWYVTNVTIITFTHWGSFWTNAVSLPLW